MNEYNGYLGCKKCIEEDTPNPSHIVASGNARINTSWAVSIKCDHHDNSLQWIDFTRKELTHGSR